MKLQIFLTFYLFFLISSYSTFGQEEPSLGVTLEIRPRSEFRNGAFTLRSKEDKPAFFISQRSRLEIDYAIEDLTLGLGLQNIRVWGSSPQIAPIEGNNTMINEAWAAYQFSEDFAIKVGRQSLVYDDDRILGSLDWNQAGRWHDLLLLQYEPANWEIHLGAGYNQDSERILGNYYSSPGNHYKSLQMVWIGHALSDQYKFSTVFLNTGLENETDSTQHFMQTFGGNFYRVNAPLKLTGTFYYQIGENRMGADVNAFLAAIYGSLNLSNSFALLAGTDYLTGNDMNEFNLNETTAFNPLYGTHHKFYGYMDYFYVGNPHMNVGLWDKYAGFKLSPSESFSLQLMGHVFDAAGNIYHVEDNENLSSYLGTEIDLTFGWLISPVFKVNGGYSQMVASESMEVVKGQGSHEQLQNWVWLMLTAKPRIF